MQSSWIVHQGANCIWNRSSGMCMRDLWTTKVIAHLCNVRSRTLAFAGDMFHSIHFGHRQGGWIASLVGSKIPNTPRFPPCKHLLKMWTWITVRCHSSVACNAVLPLSLLYFDVVSTNVALDIVTPPWMEECQDWLKQSWRITRKALSQHHVSKGLVLIKQRGGGACTHL